MLQNFSKFFMIVFLLAMFMFPQSSFAQLSGTKTIPGDYATLALAIADLNTQGVGAGGVTFNVAAGYTETTTDSLVLTATGTVSNPIVFQKSGAGVNPKITRTDAGFKTTSSLGAQGDAVITIQGSDYVTFDGIDVSADLATIEYGYYLRKVSVTDGCKFVTIKNAVIDMTKGTSAYVVGIYSSNNDASSLVSSATGIVVTSVDGRNESVAFTGNTIQDVFAGIVVRGFNHTTSPYDFYDQNYVIGASGFGNVIQNYGGNAASASYGVYMIYHNNVTIAYNNINNTAGGGSTFTSTGYGVFTSTATSSNVNINFNNIAVSSNVNSNLSAISNAAGSTAAGNTININNNTIQNNTHGTATTAVYSAIVNSGSAATLNINNNTVNNITLANTSTCPIIETGSAITVNMNSNVITNVLRSGASGITYGLKTTSPTNLTVNGNTVELFDWTNVLSTGTTYGFYGLSSAVNVTLTNNIVRNFTTPTTGTLGGLREFGVAGTKIAQNNQVYNFSTFAGGAGGATMYGIYFSTGNIDISNNVVYALNSTGTTGGASGSLVGIYVSGGTTNSVYKNKVYDISTNSTNPALYGMQIGGGTTNTVYNNLIGDLRTPAANAAIPLAGLYVSGGTTTNAYFNTVYLNASSTGALFGSAALYASTTPTLNLIDNIFVNNSTPVGATGFSSAYRRSTSTITTYANTSNNNLFYAGTPGINNLVFYDGTNSDQTIADFKTRVAPRDAASFTENANFVSTTGSNANFLHINTGIATQIESGGITVAGITDDFDGNLRNASTPDIGADEGSFPLMDLNPPVISYTVLGPTNSTSARTLVVAVTDPSGVPAAAPGWPNLYWRINAGSWNAATPTNVTGSDYTFNFGAGVVVGDLVEYYVVAQDLATPNVGAFPSAGAGGFTANPPAASTPPTTPNSYLIVGAPLSGNYTVGSALFNSVTGKNITFERSVRSVMKEVDVLVPAVEKTFEKGKEPKEIITDASDKMQTVKQMMQVEEVIWTPMENGMPYTGDLFVKKSENPNFSYPAGTEGVYATITAAVNDLNLRGVGGATTFLLTDASYTAETLPIAVNIISSSLPTAVNTVTIKPNTGVTTLIQGAGASSGAFIVRNNYVTIDGSNAGGTDRSMTIENTSVTSPNVVRILSTGTTPITNVTVKNCNLINGVNTSTAVVIYDATAVAGYFNNITIQNNSIAKAYFAIYSSAVAATGNGSGLLITGNDMNGTAANALLGYGVYAQGVDGVIVSNNNIANITQTGYTHLPTGVWFATGTQNGTISGNNISNLSYTGTSGYAPRGIAVSTGLVNSNIIVSNNTISGLATSGSVQPHGINVFSAMTGVTVESNRVSDILNSNTGGYGARGIMVNTGIASSNITLNNNFVSDVKATADAGSTYWSIGIGIEGATSGINVYHNNVNLYGSYAGYAAGTISSAFAVLTSTAAVMDVRNNIFVNTFDNTNGVSDKSYAINTATTNAAFTEINYNDYFVSGVPGVLGFLTADVTTLLAWQAATTKDANSISGDPRFVSNTDLHIDPLFDIVSNNGTPIATVTTDVDGQIRSLTTPDMGADEYIYTPPSVVDPTDVAVIPSALNINVQFTPNVANNNVVIVWNSTGTFTVPAGTPPAVGQPFAGGELLYNGLTSPVNHSGLTFGTAYYYKVFSYVSGNYSPGVTANATTAVVNPSAVTATTFSASQIDLAWTKNANNDNVMVVTNLVNTFGIPVNGTAYAVNDPVTGGGTVVFNGSATTFNHTALTSGTTYYYKVFSAEVASNYYSSGVTANATTLFALPYFQNFNASTSIPAGWSTNFSVSATHGNASNGLYKNLWSSATTGFARTPFAGLVTSTTNFEFDYRIIDYDLYPATATVLGASDIINVQVSTDNVLWTTIYTINSTTHVTSTSFAHKQLSLSAYIGNTIYVRFDCVWGAGDYYVDFDNVAIQEPPLCSVPTAVALNTITAASVNVIWSDAATIQIDYGTVGHPAGTGTIVSGVTTSPYTLSGLTSATAYGLYVRQDCGAGLYSAWDGPYNFTTSCAVVTAPYTQDFESGVFPPACWSISGTSGLWVSGLASGFGTGTYSAKANFYSVSSGTADLISVGFDASGLAASAVRFDFAYAGYSAADIDMLTILSSTNGGTDWTEVTTLLGGLGNLNPFGLIVTAAYTPIAGEWATMTLTLPAGTNLVKFRAISAYGNNLFVDNIRIVEPLANDVGTVSIDIASGNPISTIAPLATVKNYGSATNTFNVQMTITGGYTSTKTVTSLVPGASVQVAFDNWNAVEGQYTVNVCTQLGTDGDLTNDCQTKNVGVYSGTWTEGTVIPTTTYLGSGTTYQGFLFSLGGNSILGTEVNKYEAATDTWTSLAPIPVKRVVFASATVGDFIYVIGGSDGAATPAYVSTVYKYDIALNSWSTVAPLPINIAWGKAVSYNNRIYLAGGVDAPSAGNILATIYVYDVTANTWTAATSMPAGVFGGAFSITGNNLVYAGGATSTVITDAVYVGAIDPLNHLNITWTTAENTFPGIEKVQYSVNENMAAFVIPTKENAGKEINSAPENAVYPAGAMYRFDGRPWGTDGIIVAGGSPTSAWVPANPNPVYIYYPATDSWVKEYDVPVPVLGSSLGTVNSGSIWKLIVASGYTGSVSTNKTQIYTDNLSTTPSTFQLSVNILAGWNMSSVPGLHPIDQNVNTWWVNRNPLADVYKWTSTYVPVTTTTPTEGYWMLHNGVQTYNTGDEWPAGGIQFVTHNAIPVNSGWNMIGGYENSASVAGLTTTPPGLIVPNTVYGWNGTYFNPTNLEPGYGYWVLTNGAGVINPPTLIDGSTIAKQDDRSEWGKITITDATGKSYVLYSVNGEVNLDHYQMPPLPPTGAFDVRYASNRKAENLKEGNQLIEMRGMVYPVTVRVENANIKLQDETGKTVNSRLKSGEEITINNNQVNKLLVSENIIPDVYALEQNYPNPFNPSTVIEFSIPEDAVDVMLTIYDALGQRVTELVNTKLEAGKYQYQWDASNVASGLYIYELRTSKFNSVKKMILLK